MPLLQRRLLPTAVRAQLDLPAGDALLKTAVLTDGTYAAASRHALHRIIPAATGAPGTVTSYPWCDVDRAAFDPETATITVHLVDATAVALPLVPGTRPAFATTLRERVQASVVHAASLPVPGTAGVRVAVRRDGSGEMFSQVIAERGVDLADPDLAARVDELERRVRGAAGLPL